MATETLRAAVIGVGHLGQHHARLMAGLPDVELAAVVDADPERAAQIAEPLGATPLTDVAQLPDDIALASVAAPTIRHHQVGTALLRRGVHVLMEKPLAADLQAALALQELAADRGLVLQVGHIERFNPAFAAWRELDVRPRFIEAHRLAPFNYRTLDVSVVMDLMIHDLDIVLSIADSPVTSVDASGSKVLGHNVDIASARINFENGCVANVTASRVSFEPLRKTRVFGDEAFLSMDFGARKAFLVQRSEGFRLGSLTPADAERLPPQASFKEFLAQGMMDMTEVDMDECNPLELELAAFVAAVRGEPSLGVSAEAGVAAMRVAAAVTDSIANHRWVD